MQDSNYAVSQRMISEGVRALYRSLDYQLCSGDPEEAVVEVFRSMADVSKLEAAASTKSPAAR